MELHIPSRRTVLREFHDIKQFLHLRGIVCEHYPAPVADSQDVLNLLEPFLRPIMESNGYTVADVVAVAPDTPNLQQIKDKFKAEHTHTEDEVRYFVSGCGYFWFNLEDPVFCVKCEPGDFISVPAGSRHWFEMDEPPKFTVVRLFIDPSGWTPHYTQENIARHYRSLPLPAHV